MNNQQMSSKDWLESKPNDLSLLTLTSKYNFFRNGQIKFEVRNGQGEVKEMKMFVREDAMWRPVHG